ncbi:MAG: cytochrome b N-terminal domain-containing protein [Firmicutes bacterium]|nr:cytochrome b N-terminal domain-containing protein [Bacillota bacterium]
MSDRNWTRAVRRWIESEVPLEELLPDELPAYVDSYVYLFGVLTLSAFILLVASGVVLAFAGPDWWHVSGVGHFVNSVHFWGVQAFFFFMVLHLWAQFFMAAWRDGRGANWATGVLLFFVSIVAAFTGFLSQQNFDSQWIGLQGKDAFNALGVGSFFNLLNFGQMYGLHVAVVPLIIALLIGVHILLVRAKGVVEPIPVDRRRRGGRDGRPA